ncbi:hypothetical protein SAMN02745857_03324 [Andreprevotia lacus DSM 23236]|jgi:hypothetical protein|uniref:YqjK-like protein n=1 Tax=Andreprevotia lacus DSM 23236 TaxID=1121001 RepID=A0A1W1XXJ5_9NEIS|nr:hypothetical protein [Andreprevotia lacus]SMC28577.1 hypothetical protein SAMN02745857_03324 [Andreprevotia lacus DSM 23236]
MSRRNLSRSELRRMRKEALQLQADAYRMQLGHDWQALRQPVDQSIGGGKLLGLLGNPLQLVELAGKLMTHGRLGWIARAIPLALTGWRVARLLRSWLRRKQRDEG